ncbi:MAG: helix-hairpin-helix domain-containing protein [Gammaproteobacteria bacterium]|jgi:putative hydrolase
MAKNSAIQTQNHEIALKLREIATLLRNQRANPFRVNAYLHAAETLDGLDRDVGRLLEEKGIKGLVGLPGIGDGIARSIYEYVATGRMSRLESLHGRADPVALLRSIPTIGPQLAERIHDSLGIDSLETLENAVRDGRLAEVEGLGDKRRRAIEAWLQQHLDRQRRRPSSAPPGKVPPVELLLRVDHEYREKSRAGMLPKIAPKRFNPENRAWLSILHATYGGWHFTALYSNTARAHDLKRVFDWVVIYYYDDDHREGQHTVVTETRGDLAGERVVRGRETECHRYYAESAAVH